MNLSDLQADGRNVIIADNQARVTIQDDNPVISIDDVMVYDRDTDILVTVTLDQAVTNPVSVDYATQNYTAFHNSNYFSTSGTLTFNPGELTQSFYITPKNTSSSPQPDSIFLVNLTNIQSDGTEVLFADDQADITLVGDEPPTISIDDLVIEEGNDGFHYAIFTVTRTGKKPGDLNRLERVEFTATEGTAKPGEDYIVYPTAFYFQHSNELVQTETVRVRAQILGDEITEYNKTFQVILTGNSADGIIIDGIATATIQNDDKIELTIDDITVDEFSSTATLNVSLSGTFAGTDQITFDYDTLAGTAFEGTDYTRLTGTGSISAGASETTLTINLTGNELFEFDRYFDVVLSNFQLNGLDINIADSQARVTIQNDYGPNSFELQTKLNPNLSDPQFQSFGTNFATDGDTFISIDPNWQHGDGLAQFFVRNDQGTPADFSDDTWEFLQGSIQPDQRGNYLFGSSMVIEGDIAVFGAVVAPDAPDDPRTGVVYVFLKNGDNYFLKQTLTPSDTSGSFQYGATVAIEGETIIVGDPGDDSSEGAVFVYSRSGGVWSESAKLTATTPAPQSNFGSTVDIDNSTIVIGARNDAEAGFQSGAVYIATLVNDAWTVTQKLQSSQPRSEEHFGSSVSIQGNTLVVGAVDGRQDSLTRSAAYVFTLENSIWQESEILQADQPVADTAFGADVLIQDDQILIKSYAEPGNPDGNNVIHAFLRIADDWVSQGTISAPASSGQIRFGSSLGIANGAIYIGASEDNGGEGTIHLFRSALKDLSVDRADLIQQPDGSKLLVLEVTRTAAHAGGLKSSAIIDFSTFNIGDSSGLYQSLEGTLYFDGNPNSVSQTETFVLQIDGAVPLNLDSTFTIALSQRTGSDYQPQTVSPIIIVDNPPVLSIDDVSVSEAAGTATLTVSLNQALTTAVTVDYSTFDQSAFAGMDYQQAAGTLTFAAGEQTKTITVSLIDSDLVEFNETLLVNLTNLQSGGAAVYLGDSEGLVTITDDDQATLSIDDVTVNEDAETATLTVSLDRAVDGAIYINYATLRETASNPEDFLSQSGILYFNSGELSQTVTIDLLEDDIYELTESFVVTLSQLQSGGLNVVVPDPQGQIEIIDNEPLPDYWLGEKILPPGDPMAGLEFGNEMDVDGNLIITSPRGFQSIGDEYVAAYIYTNWTHTATLTVPASDFWSPTAQAYRSEPEFAGFRVAINGDTAVVAANNYRGGLSDHTAVVYRFKLSDGVWSLDRKIGIDNTASGNSTARSGISIDINKNWIVIGTPGTNRVMVLGDAYNYLSPTNRTWNLDQYIGRPDSYYRNFGSKVVLQDSTLVVTSSLDSSGLYNTEGAFVYEFSNHSWSLTQKLIPNDPAESDFSVTSIDIDGDRIVVGTINQNAYVFTRDTATNVWAESHRFTPTDFQMDPPAWTNVQIYGSRIVISSATMTEEYGSPETLTLYQLENDEWVEQIVLTSPDAEFSSGIAFYNSSTVFFSSPSDDEFAENQGAIHAYWPIDSTVYVRSVEISESDQGIRQARVAVIRRGNLKFPAQVDFSTSDGSATLLDGDYAALSGTLMFPEDPVALSQMIEFTIDIYGDTKVEDDEYFNIDLSNPVGNVRINTTSHPVTIRNDDHPALLIDDVTVDESAGVAYVTVTLDHPLEQAVTVDYQTADQTAADAADYQTTSGSLTFNSYEQTKTITIPIVNSDTVELAETFLVNLSNVQTTGFAVSIADSQAVVTITDDDRAGFSVADVSVNEESGTAVVTVSLDQPVDGPVSVNYTTADGSAVEGTDYLGASGTLTFDAGQQTGEIIIDLIDTALIELDEIFLVNLSLLQNNGRDIILVDNQAEVTILNTDQAAFSINDLSVDENAGTATLTVTLDQLVDGTVTVDFSTAPNTAFSPSDYQSVSGTLTFNPGVQSQTITVSLVDSEIKEYDEIFNVNLSNIQSAGRDVVFAKQQSAVTILDDEWGLLSINDVSVDENTGVAELTVTLDRPDEALFTVDFITSSESAESDSDYQHTTGTLTFQPGELTQTITIPLIDTDLVELDETFLVSLLNVQTAGIGPRLHDPQGQVTILNDDQAAISIADLTVNENEGTANVIVSLDHPVASTFTIDFAATADSALAGSDFVPLADRLSFAPLEQTQTITIPLVNTGQVEFDESFLVNLAHLQAAGFNVIFADTQAEVTIHDSTQASVSIDDITVDENASTATLTVTLDQPVNATVTIDFTTQDQSAVSGTDYQTTTGTLTFNPNQVSQTITIPIVDSSNVELTESFLVQLSNIQASELDVVLTDSQGEVTILDDDRAKLSIGDATVNEGAGTVEVFVSLNKPDDTLFTVDYTINDGTAHAGTDYQNSTGTLTFTPGDMIQKITIPIIESGLVEADETFFVNLSHVQSGFVAPEIVDAQAEVTITDNDQATIAIDDLTVNEDDGYAVVTLSLNQAIDAPVSVDFATQNASATSSGDYQAASGTVTFAPGALTQTITIYLNNSEVVELDETFVVNLSNVQSGGALVSLADNQATITILDQDSARVSIDDATVNEEAGTVTLTVSLDQAVDNQIRVNYRTVNQSAISSQDYYYKSGSLYFNPGERFQTITLILIDNDFAESTENFEVELTSIESYARDVAISDNRGNVEILDYDHEVRAPELTSSIFAPATIHDEFGFGYKTYIDGDTLAVSSMQYDGNEVGFGAVFIYTRDAQGTPSDFSDDIWQYQATIKPPVGGLHNFFGDSLAIDGDTILIGDSTVGVRNGSVYVYTRTGQTWSLQQQLFASDSDRYAYFGHSVDIENDTIVIGARAADTLNYNGEVEVESSGAVYVFKFINGSWRETEILGASDPEESKNFGANVILDGTTLFVSASNDGISGPGDFDADGAVYIFKNYSSPYYGSGWFQIKKLKPQVNNPGEYFGTSIALEGDTLVVGASQHKAFDPNTQMEISRGAAYIFNRNSSGTWIESQILLPTLTEEEHFGGDVKIKNGNILVQSDSPPPFRFSNSTLHHFTLEGQTWTLQNKINSTGLEASADFGTSFALTEDAVVIGVSYDDVLEDFFGAVHFYSPFALPEISVGDVTVTEVDNGSQLVTVPVTRTGRFKGNLGSSASINFTTVDGTALAGSLDYVENSGTITFAGSYSDLVQTESITFVLNGDDRIEGEETLSIEISYGSGKYYIHKSTGTVTVIDTDQATLTIDDISVDKSTQSAVLTVSLDKQFSKQFTVNYTTEDLSATGGTDYQTSTGILNFGSNARSRTITIPIINDSPAEISEQFLVNLFNIQADWIDVASSDLQALVTITDVPSRISIEDVSINQDAETAVLTVTLDQPLLYDVTVDFATADQTAIALEDYLSQSGTVTIHAGELSQTISIPLVDTDLIETDETFLVNLMNPFANGLDIILADNQAEVTIVENDSAMISIDDITVDESSGTATLTVSLDHPVNSEVSVDFTTRDLSAVASHDYLATSGTLTFAPNEVSRTITISLIDTDNAEASEAFLVDLSNIQSNGHNVGFLKDQARVTIEDDEVSLLSIDDVSVNEDSGFAEITVSLDRSIPFPLILDYQTEDNTADSDSDYQATTGTLIFPPDSLTQTFTIAITDSDLVELDESFFVNFLVLQTAGANISFPDSQIEIFIADDDQAQVTIDDITIDEEAGSATLTVSLDLPVATTISLDYATADGTALSTEDYQSTSGTVTFTPGELSASITIPIINTNLIEDEESFLVNLSNLQANGLDINLGDDQAVVTITDSDQPAFSINDVSVDEDAGTAILTVTLDQPLTSVITVDFATADQTANSISDYQQQSGTLTFNPGETTQTIQISILDSDITEADETFLVNLLNPQSSLFQPRLTKNQAVVTIHDDDQSTLSIADITVDETAAAALITVSLDQKVEGVFSVDFATGDQVAVSGADYLATSGTLTFNPNNLTQTISVPLVNSELVELDEIFLVNIFNLQTQGLAVSIADTQAEVTIDDDDQAKVIIDEISVNEETGSAILTVSLDHPVDTSISVDYSTADGTATSGSDYQSTTGTLTFNPNQQTQTITIPLINTSLVEDEEYFLVNLSNLQSNGRDVVLGMTQTVVTITDTDQPAFSIDDIIVNEGSATANITITLDQPLTSIVTVDFSTADQTATSGTDYQATSGTVIFNPGDTSIIIQIPIINSDTTEVDETFIVNLSNPQSSVYEPTLATSQAIVTIQDNDPGSISINDISINEGTGTALVTVSLDREANTAVSIDYATSDGSAVSGSDYQSASGTLTFTPGETSLTISIPLIDSDLIETAEIFYVNLSNLQAPGLDVSLSDDRGQVTILDDDRATLSIQDLLVDEDIGTALLTVSLDQALLTSIAIDFETLNGTALAGSDFTATSGTLIFSPEVTTQTISLTILNDTLLESTESFFVSFSNLQQNGSLVDLDNDQAEITIRDNDQAILSINDVEFYEDIGIASLTVSLDKAVSTAFTVDYQTSDGTALVDTDYLQSSGSLTFNAGDVSKTIYVSIVDTDNVELTEMLQVLLSNLQGADSFVILSDAVGEISILDDDQATLSINSVTVNESSGTAQLTVSLDRIVDLAVQVNYSTSDQSASAGTDYVSTSGTLTFDPGQTTNTINISLIDNDLLEIDETFLVTLSQLQTSAAVTLSDPLATITIEDDEQASISVQDIIVNEAAGKAILTVVLNQLVDTTFTVDFTTLDQSASSTGDYLSQSGTLTFAPGVTHQTIEIDLVDDSTVELPELFEVHLSNLQAGVWNVILSDDQATVTIQDDDLGDYEFKYKLYAEGTIHDSDRFGADPEIDGDTLITGAISWDDTYPDSGGAFIYVRNDQGTPEYAGDDTWEYQATLLPPDADGDEDRFGWSVDISGDTAVVGALFGDGAAEIMGAVYVFTRSNGVWSFEQKLTVSDTINNGYFGDTVAIEGDTIVAGAMGSDNYSGSAYIFTRENGVWSETAKLTADTPEEWTNFAEEIEIDNSTIVISATLASGTYSQSGAVYIYTKQDGIWTQLQKLTDPDPSLSGAFGNGISIQGDLILVGATSLTDQPLSAGKAVLFQRDPDSGLWTSLQTLTASDSAFNSFFGTEIEIHNQQIFINASNDPTGIGNSGAIYVFGLENQTWVEQQKISYPDTGSSSDFGKVFAVADGAILISARLDDEVINNAGSIYVYGLPQNPTITIDDVSLTEEDDGSQLVTATITRTATKPGDLIYGASVEFRTVDGTATVSGGDYESTTGTITFTSDPVATSQTQTISIRVYGDNVAEADESFLIELLNVTGHARLPESPATVTIENDDLATLSIEDVTIAEDGVTAQVTVTLDAPIETSVSVNYATTGLTATSGSDFVAASGTLTFNPSETSKTISIVIIDAPQVEADETFQIDLTQIQSDADVRFADDQAIITIRDDDQATISIADLTISESAGRAYLTVSVDNSSDLAYSFDYTTIDQSASSPDDYLSKTGTITLNPGHLNATITIDLVNGIPVEPIETFAVQLSNLQAGGRNIIFADDTASITIVDDDLTVYDWDSKLYAVGTQNINDQFGYSVATDGNTLISTSLFWNASYPSQGAAFVYVRNDQGTPDDTSDDTWDYQDILLAPDVDNGPADRFGWSVDISGDTAVVGATLGDGTVEDMGSVYVYTRSNGNWSFQQELNVEETSESHFFGDVVKIEGDTIVVGARATENYTGSAYVFQRTDGVWTETAKLLADDPAENANFGGAIDIENSTIVIGARFDSESSTRSGAVYIFEEQAGSWTQTQKIKDDSPTYLGTFGTAVSLSGDLLLVGAISTSDRAESTGKAVLYQRDPGSGNWNSIQTLTASDSILNSYFGISVEIHDQQIFIGSAKDPTGVDFNNAVYLFELEDQTWVEQQKISSPDAEYGDQFGRNFAITNGTLFISAQYDNDKATNAGSIYIYNLAQKPGITIEDVSVTEEDDGSRLITANVTRTATKPGELLYGASVDFRTLDGTAQVAAGDYESTTGTLIFESDPDASSQTRTISIRIYSDALPEIDETFGVELLNVTGHARISDPDATITIQNDDQSTLTINDISVNEDAGFAEVTVSLTQPLETALSIDYATSDQTAESATDYTSTSGTLTFNPGITSQTIVIPIIDSDMVELDETFFVNLSNLQTSDSNVILGDSQSEVTIINDDQTTLSINDITVNEDAGTATLTVSLNQFVDTAISVDFTTVDQSALQTDDYSATTGTLTFNVGELSQIITIAINDSDIIESDELLLINLSGLQSEGRSVSLADSQGQVTILDDDQATVSIDDAIVSESDGTISLTVSLDHAVDSTISIDYSTTDQSADSTSDFQSIAGTLTFNPGETSQSIVIAITDSTQIEADETFLVNLSNLQSNGSNVITANSPAQVTISDDDQGTFSITDATVDENAGTATLTVTLTGIVDTTINVDYATTDQTASAGSDYTSSFGTLSFAPGVETQTIVIPIIDSDLIESDETLLVTLSGIQASGRDVILSKNQGQVTILDDEEVSASISLRVTDRPTDTTDNGESETLPTNIDYVSEWTSYWVELWIDAQNPTGQGVHSAALDLSYQTAYTTATEIQFGPAFTRNQSGQIDDTTGRISQLSAETENSQLGDTRYLLLARIRFESLGDDQVLLDLNGHSIGPHDLELEISSPQVTLEGNAELSTTAGHFPGIEIWANPYDLNDDNRINFRDLLLFASVYNAIPSQSDSDYAWFADLNKNDRVEFKDLLLFASNYNKTREARDQVNYASSYPEVWNNLLTVESQAEPPLIVEPLKQTTAQSMLDSAVDEVSSQVSPVDSQKLESINIQVTDLAGDTLGRAAGNTIYIDSNAAGYGWFIDATPTSHDEFTESSDLTLIALPDSGVARQVDLWSVIMHELGHLLGYDHEESGWMEDSLVHGVRKLPAWETEADQFFTDLSDDMSIIL